jgi:predicted alpha/beta-hydrolase family hydrolase
MITETRFPATPTSGDVSATLWRPAGARWLLVYGHGAGAGMNHPFNEGVAAALASRRIATFRYQFPYAEAGRRRPDRTSILTATVRAAVEAGSAAVGDLPLIAGGKSMGGRMTSTAAAEEPLGEVRGIVFFGFPLHGPGEASSDRAAHLDLVPVPMLFLQGTRDRLADIDRMRRVCMGLRERAKLHVVDGADHSFSVPKRSGRTQEEIRQDLADAVSTWVEQIRL